MKMFQQRSRIGIRQDAGANGEERWQPRVPVGRNICQSPRDRGNIKRMERFYREPE